MSHPDSMSTGSQERQVNDDSKPGTNTLSHLMEFGSHDGSNAMQVDTDSHSVSSAASLQFEFFDKEEQKRREEYRNRVERHYCRLIEEERLSPESASVLSDAFAEAEVRAKYGTIREKSEVNPEYHTGIDKTVWQEIDHQRSKSFERLKSQHKDFISNDNYDNYNKDTPKVSLNTDQSRDSLDFNNDFKHNYACDLDSSAHMDDAQFDMDVEANGTNNKSPAEESLESSGNLSVDLMRNSTELSGSGGNYNEADESNETLNLESEEERSDSDDSEDEFDFTKNGKREWINRRGDMAVEKSMEAWLGSPRGIDRENGGRMYYKQQMNQYKEKVAAKERSRITELLKQSASVPSASPTPMDYDADEELSTKGTPRSSSQSLDQWSDSHVNDDKSENNTTTDDSGKLYYDFLPKAMSSRSSISSEKNRVDPLTYQSYTAGLLHSSGKSEKFLKLQKHFAVLERITDIEEKSQQHGPSFCQIQDDHCVDTEIFAKYDVQSMEELQWLYQELGEARKNEEFFYDLQKLAVYQWKPTKDHGLKKKGKSLNDLRTFYENLDEDEREKGDNPFQDTFFNNAMKAEKHKKSEEHDSTPEKSKSEKVLDKSDRCPNIPPRPLYGTNIPEKLDDFEIIVEAKKQKIKENHDLSIDNLHIRSISAPYTKHLQGVSAAEDPVHRRSDSFKGALFAKNPRYEGSEKKPKPTVAQVTPVPRQVRQKSILYPKIMSGPHDFASHKTTTEAVARPMQSNLHIYNSLENPQYKANVNLDEPVRRLSRCRSNDSFVIQKDAEGNYSVTTTDGNPNKFTQNKNRSPRIPTVDNPYIAVLDQHEQKDPKNDTLSLQDSNFVIPSPETLQESMHIVPRETMAATRMNVTSSSNPTTVKYQVHVVNKSPITSVRDVIAKIENKDIESGASSGTCEVDTQLIGPPNSYQAKTLLRRSMIPDLLENQPMSDIGSSCLHQCERSNSDLFLPNHVPQHEIKRSHRYQLVANTRQVQSEHAITEESVAPLCASHDPPRIVASSKSFHALPNFKIRDLRPLAQNNEFCKSKFFPKSVSTELIHHTEPDRNGIKEPMLHKPVIGKIFKSRVKGREKLVEIDNSSYNEVRRNSCSSNDTFIVKESDDETEAQYRPDYDMDMKDTFDRVSRSKSEPDLTEQEGPHRPRSAKSHANLNVCLQPGRHCVPRTVSGDLLVIQNKFRDSSDRFGREIHQQLSSDSSGHSGESASLGNEDMIPVNMQRKESFEGYMPPDEIVNDMMKSSELYKKSIPKEKPKTPSVVGKMTMDYLQVIGNEWAVSKGPMYNNERGSNENVTLPNVEPFVGAANSATPNRWLPVIETRHSSRRVNLQNAGKEEDPSKQTATTRSNVHNTTNALNAWETCLVENSESEFNKYLTMPRKPKSKHGTADGFTYSTIPRMRPDRQINKSTYDQTDAHGLDSDMGKTMCTDIHVIVSVL